MALVLLAGASVALTSRADEGSKADEGARTRRFVTRYQKIKCGIDLPLSYTCTIQPCGEMCALEAWISEYPSHVERTENADRGFSKIGHRSCTRWRVKRRVVVGALGIHECQPVEMVADEEEPSGTFATDG
jgi:hypothetical protein